MPNTLVSASSAYMPIVSVKIPGTYFYELSSESVTTWIQDQRQSFTVQESLFASIIFATSWILPFLVAATDFSQLCRPSDLSFYLYRPAEVLRGFSSGTLFSTMSVVFPAA